MTAGRLQLACLLLAAMALAGYYLLDLAQLANATLVVVRDLKLQGQETAAAVSKLMHESEESE
jgi:hypothetical protein